MSEKHNDGQSRSNSYYNPGEQSGMKSSISRPARVGQSSGGEQAMSVPKPSRDADIKTTTGSAGPRVSGEITHGDDK